MSYHVTRTDICLTGVSFLVELTVASWLVWRRWTRVRPRGL